MTRATIRHKETITAYYKGLNSISWLKSVVAKSIRFNKRNKRNNCVVKIITK